MVLGLILVTALGAGCEKDTDCKGDRVCESGKCVAPASVAPPPQPPKRVPLGGRAEEPVFPPPTAPAEEQEPLLPPPPPPPQEERRVPLGNPSPARSVDSCEDPLDLDGRLRPECRVEPGRSSPKAGRNRRGTAATGKLIEEEPAARGVGLIAVMYGVLAAGGSAVPAFAFTAAGGVRFRSGIGFVGVLHGRIFLGTGASIQLYGFGPGIRFGDKSMFTLAITPTFGVASARSSSASGGLFSILAQLALVLGDHFTFLAQPTIDFDGSGVIGSFTGGLGITF